MATRTRAVRPALATQYERARLEAGENVCTTQFANLGFLVLLVLTRETLCRFLAVLAL